MDYKSEGPKQAPKPEFNKPSTSTMDSQQKRELLEGRLQSLEQKLNKPRKKIKLSQAEKDLLSALRKAIGLDENAPKKTVITEAKKRTSDDLFVNRVHIIENKAKKTQQEPPSTSPAKATNKTDQLEVRDKHENPKRLNPKKRQVKRIYRPGEQKPKVKRFIYDEEKRNNLQTQHLTQQKPFATETATGNLRKPEPIEVDPVETARKRSLRLKGQIDAALARERQQERSIEWFQEKSRATKYGKPMTVTTKGGGKKIKITAQEIFDGETDMKLLPDGTLECSLAYNTASGKQKVLVEPQEDFLEISVRKIRLRKMVENAPKSKKQKEEQQERGKNIEKIQGNELAQFASFVNASEYWPKILQRQGTRMSALYSVSEEDIDGTNGKFCLGLSSLSKSTSPKMACTALKNFKNEIIFRAGCKGIHFDPDDIVFNEHKKLANISLIFSRKAANTLVSVLNADQNVVSREKGREYNDSASTVNERAWSRAFLKNTEEQTSRMDAEHKKESLKKKLRLHRKPSSSQSDSTNNPAKLKHSTLFSKPKPKPNANIDNSAYSAYTAGVKAYKAKKFNEAITNLEIAVSGYKEDNDSKSEATVYSTLASCYRELGEFEKALECCEQCLSIRKEYGMNEGSKEYDAIINKREGIMKKMQEQGSARMEASISM